MADWLTEDDARALLVRCIAACGTADRFAEKAGCSRALVSYALNGVRPVGPKLAGVLGLIAVPVKTYRYLPRESQAAPPA